MFLCTVKYSCLLLHSLIFSHFKLHTNPCFEILQSWRTGRHNERTETATKHLKTKVRSTREMKCNYIYNVLFSICYFFIFCHNMKDPLIKSGLSDLSSFLINSSLWLVAEDKVNTARYFILKLKYKTSSRTSS